MSAPSHRTTRDRTGELVGGRYRLTELIDRGGQGMVYRAHDQRDHDLVAIKILKDTVTARSEWRERMFREAHALANLGGTAAVRVLDQLWTDDGALCLVMEYLHGQDLEDHLRGIEAGGGRMSVGALLELVAPVVDTLEAAHAQGIVHRDVKPANIYVIDATHGGGVRLLDFGLAKFMRLPSFTQDGFIAGSPSYIAPEAWKGGSVDQRIDVYALGAVMYRALAGRPPFTADDLETMLRLATGAERPSLHALRPDLPVDVDVWVKQVLSINRDHRFMRVSGMLRAFESLFNQPADPARAI